MVTALPLRVFPFKIAGFIEGGGIFAKYGTKRCLELLFGHNGAIIEPIIRSAYPIINPLVQEYYISSVPFDSQMEPRLFF
jgi:hypothetical protein